MTVSQLIELLQEQDQFADVHIPCQTGGTHIVVEVEEDEDGVVQIS